MKRKIVPVIMAGGKGTRLWPLSRSAAPKQFMQFVGDRTLFQSALLRISNQDLYEPAVVVTNEQFRFVVAEQARELGIELSTILLEPIARNTAAAISAAAAHVSSLFGKEAIIQVLASDHDITVDQNYLNANIVALAAAMEGQLVTFGITPTEPATGYGYIEIGGALPSGAYSVKRFVEKPALHHAVEMLSAGGFYWNSGMFMFSASTLLDEMAKHCPEVLRAACSAVLSATSDLNFVRLETLAFEKSPNISIDYAIMEKTSKAAVVPSAFKWSDLGSWDSVWKAGGYDVNKNVVSANATLKNTSNSLVLTRNAHIVVQGLDGVAVIASEDAIYVGRLEDSQNVGDVVQLLAAAPATSRLTEVHPTTYRPWGGYTLILSGEGFQVKRIFVTPGKKLSLQRHHHRSEHWVVVKGFAEVTVGENAQILGENESIHIPVGEPHRLANAGKTTLELIEVQTGPYLGDDDIFRISSDFGRN